MTDGLEPDTGAFGERRVDVEKVGYEQRESLADVESNRHPEAVVSSIIRKLVRTLLADGCMLSSIETMTEFAMQHGEEPGSAPVEVLIVKAWGMKIR